MRQLDGLKEKTNEELLAMYDRDRQLEVKQELTLRYLYIAKAVAIQMHNLYADFMQMEDIINEGAIAIMKGIERYDPERDNKFETFISRRIRGMIIDIIRKNDWMPRNTINSTGPLRTPGQSFRTGWGVRPRMTKSQAI